MGIREQLWVCIREQLWVHDTSYGYKRAVMGIREQLWV